MEYKKPKGTRDILPQNAIVWQFMEDKAKEIARQYNYKQIKTPTFEEAQLFTRSVGDSSDIVNKEMYQFKDRGDRLMALRPEGTAGVVRAGAENGLFNDALPLKLFYFANCFRYENPQAGRYREFEQFGVECFGADSPCADVELIDLLQRYLESIGITNSTLLLNSIGCKKCRQEYNKAMKEFAQNNHDLLCEDCKRRATQNPLRMLDCKNEKCQEVLKQAPKLSDYLCQDCKNHFTQVTKMLDALKIEYKITPNLVRGLDYYTKTVFEFENTIADKKISIAGGGRYDDLVQEISGKPCSALGFGASLDRLEGLVDKSLIVQEPINLLVNAGNVTVEQILPVAQKLRDLGENIEVNIMERSFNAQLKYANKIGAENVYIIGDNELANGEITVKNLISGEQKAKKFDF